MLRRVVLEITDVSEESRFLQEPHSVTSQETAFFNSSMHITTMQSANITEIEMIRVHFLFYVCFTKAVIIYIRLQLRIILW
jgi:hypothetical protein